MKNKNIEAAIKKVVAALREGDIKSIAYATFHSKKDKPSEKENLEDAELAADVNAVVAAMLCSFGIKVEVGAAVYTAEVEERENGVSE